METLNVLEAEELLRLCRGGRLYDVEKWIAAGKSLALPPGTRSTPLGIAINNGFHSLAELLARHARVPATALVARGIQCHRSAAIFKGFISSIET